MGPITTSVRRSPGFRTWGQMESLENLQSSQQEKGAKGINEGPAGETGTWDLISSWGHQPAGARVKTVKGVRTYLVQSSPDLERECRCFSSLQNVTFTRES